MAKPAVLSPAKAREWIYASGASQSLWRDVERSRAKRLLETLERLRPAAPEIAGSLSFFLRAGAAASQRVASHPAFALWVGVAARSEELRALPQESAEAFLSQVHGFSAALACIGKRPLSLAAVLDDRGRFHLRGLRAYLDAGPGAAGRRAFIAVSPESLHVSIPPEAKPVRVGLGILRQSAASAALVGGPSGGQPFRGFSLRWNPSVAGSMEIDDSDPLLQMAADRNDPYQHKTAALSAPESERFAAVLRRAMAKIAGVDPLLAEEISESIRVIVPLLREDPKKHVSSTYSSLPGTVFLCHDEDPFVQAETLVHEACHNKLNALMTLDPLFAGARQEARYFSPWRKDARPLRGILLGAHAFLNVTRFYALSAANRPGNGLLERLRREAAMRWLQVDLAVEVLERHGRFTPAGQGLVAGMRERLLGLLDVLPQRVGGVWGAAAEAVERHRELYRGPDGLHRAP